MIKSLMVSLFLFGVVTLPTSQAFVSAKTTRRQIQIHTRKSKQRQLRPCLHNILKIRGGDASSSPSPLLMAGASDYSEAAKALFGNIVGPASMLTGGLVPLGFLAEPLPVDADNEKARAWKKKARCLYMALAVASLVNELVAIMYATVACNKLTEVASRPAVSVFALIKRDYELSWIATNVHFMLGLFGFCAMITLRALCIYPKLLNTSTAGLAFSAFLGMVSIVNVGVSEGDGRGHALGGNVVSLGIRYLTLLLKAFYEKKTVMGMVSFGLFCYSAVRTIQNLMNPESRKD